MNEQGTELGQAWEALGFQETYLAFFSDDKAEALRTVATLLLQSRADFHASSVCDLYRHWRAIGRDLRRLQRTLLTFAELFGERAGDLPDDVRQYIRQHLEAQTKLRAEAVGKLAQQFEEEVEGAMSL